MIKSLSLLPSSLTQLRAHHKTMCSWHTFFAYKHESLFPDFYSCLFLVSFTLQYPRSRHQYFKNSPKIHYDKTATPVKQLMLFEISVVIFKIVFICSSVNLLLFPTLPGSAYHPFRIRYLKVSVGITMT
jgi:hypothetical protein